MVAFVGDLTCPIAVLCSGRMAEEQAGKRLASCKTLATKAVRHCGIVLAS